MYIEKVWGKLTGDECYQQQKCWWQQKWGLISQYQSVLHNSVSPIVCSIELTQFKNWTERSFDSLSTEELFKSLQTTLFRFALFIFCFTIFLFLPLQLEK